MLIVFMWWKLYNMHQDKLLFPNLSAWLFADGVYGKPRMAVTAKTAGANGNREEINLIPQCTCAELAVLIHCVMLYSWTCYMKESSKVGVYICCVSSYINTES